MCFVLIKHDEQQAVLVLHWARQGFVKARTAQANQIRGLLGENGILLPQGIGHIAKRLPDILGGGRFEPQRGCPEVGSFSVGGRAGSGAKHFGDGL
jgi:hypothetical protein